MVRFIIVLTANSEYDGIKFTFQYGQIYYANISNLLNGFNAIYIPIWLDLLLGTLQTNFKASDIFTFQYGQIYYKEKERERQPFIKIYIPIWLDLLSYTDTVQEQENPQIYIPIWLDLL